MQCSYYYANRCNDSSSVTTVSTHVTVCSTEHYRNTLLNYILALDTIGTIDIGVADVDTLT